MSKLNLSRQAQCARLLAWLREHGQIATSECRELLAIMSPAARMMELRKQGFSIKTVWRKVSDSEGVIHTQGVYIMGAGGCEHE
ncbi:hypothetical protein GPA22_09600 [Aromatoleum toluvorans]|uniref:Winged helix-turn-helix domain-containing protein n=1 Tax=Aromatoleum toluvorans TaxID=92002 RepID=A0ABX1PX03_9RHOO|nr:helix-turn-helix domain-containing protein [Aromatoleum toluvorans]NMG43981.1 hypothetical protein [Aromatoleum toluvorans]